MDVDTFDTSMIYGHGSEATYSKLMSHHAEMIKSAQGTIMTCLDAILNLKIKSTPPCDGGVLTFVDYGTADGGNVLPVFKEMIKLVHKRCGKQQQINLVFEDQLKNDFNALFRTVQGNSDNDYKLDISTENVFILANATSMYDQCLPDNTVDFGVSSIALHWLSQRPCVMEYGLWYSPESANENLYRKQAEKDWINFLTSREKELKTGGILSLIVLICPEKTDGVCHIKKVIGLLDESYKELLKTEDVSHEELTRTNVYIYPREINELRKPFNNEDWVFGRLKLQELKTKVVPVTPSKLPKDGTEKSNNGYASSFVDIVRPWITNTLMSGLMNTRSDGEKRRIVDLFMTKLFNKFKAMKDQPDFTYYVAELVIEKI